MEYHGYSKWLRDHCATAADPDVRGGNANLSLVPESGQIHATCSDPGQILIRATINRRWDCSYALTGPTGSPSLAMPLGQTTQKKKRKSSLCCQIMAGFVETPWFRIRISIYLHIYCNIHRISLHAQAAWDLGSSASAYSHSEQYAQARPAERYRV